MDEKGKRKIIGSRIKDEKDTYCTICVGKSRFFDGSKKWKVYTDRELQEHLMNKHTKKELVEFILFWRSTDLRHEQGN
jgi:hypothetical protein